MNQIITNQKSKEALNAAGAFRQAYALAKKWKAAIWILTIALAIIQVVTTVFKAHIPFDLTPMVVGVLIITVFLSSFGKEFFVNHYQELGAKAQKMHDHIVFGAFPKPSHTDITPAKIHQLSQKWFVANPADKAILETWWSPFVEKIPQDPAIILCSLSTFGWEAGLRVKYNQFLILTISLVLFLSVALSISLDYKVSEYIIYVFAPITPFLSVLCDEFLANKKAKTIAEKSYQDCHTLWNETHGNADCERTMQQMKLLMSSWQEYRYSATPIFGWIYDRLRNKMETNMQIDCDAYAKEYLDAMQSN